MGKSSKFEICSSSLVCVAVVIVVAAVSCLFFTCFLGSGLYGTFLVTVIVLVLSSVFLLKFTRKKKKKKVTFDENPAQEEDPVSCKVSNFVGDVQVCEKVEEKMQALMGNEEENEAAAAKESSFSGKVSNFDLVGEKVEVKMQALMENDEQGSPFCGKVSSFVGDVQVREKMQALMENVEENEGVGFVKEPYFDFLSGSGSSTSGDEEGGNFEIDWMCYKNINRGHDQNEGMMRSSSDSISSEDDDEDGLIEISIPGSEEEEEEEEEKEEDQTNYKQKLGHDQECINMKQLQADSDFNEEENLIEIDISVGSIKCSRFEIEA